jgi:DNA replication protein DnaC
MNTQETLSQLEKLKLHGMSKAYQGVLAMPVQEQPSLHQFMARMAQAECLERDRKRTEANIKQSKMRYNAVLEQLEFTTTRNLNRDHLETLADCSYIYRGENILITGATGCGKSYLACALGRQACNFGYKVLYLGMIRFLEMINQSHLDGTFIKQINRIEKIDVLILDDFGIQNLSASQRIALLQVIEDRYATRSTIITSQLPVANWHQYINESTIADAIMDRLSASAHRFELKGESLRKRNIK